MTMRYALTEILNMWQLSLKSEVLSENTVNAYALDVSLLTRFLEKYKEQVVNLETFELLEKQDVRAWFLEQRNRHISQKSISRSLSALKNFLKFLINQKIIESSEILDMRTPKTQKSLPRPLTIDQINNILSSISELKRTDWMVKRDRAILVLIYSVGLRISEALALNKSDILNSSNGFIKILGKGGKERMVPVLDSIKSVIVDYIESSDDQTSEALFVNRDGKRISSSSIQKLIKKSREFLGLSEKVTPHAFRHSCATHLMEDTGDLRGIQELLGHSSISSTQVYADVAQSYISSVYEKCHPLSRIQMEHKQ